jgi:hypothetical protein
MATSSTGTRVYLSIIGLMLAVVGGFFFALMWRSFQRARDVEKWPVVPCVILRSAADERQVDPNGPVERRFSVLYGYEWDGGRHDSELRTLRDKRRGGGWTSKENDVQALIGRYPEGSTQECHVNPADPETAVLEVESKAPGYSLWFPGLFVVGGLGIIVGAWRR